MTAALRRSLVVVELTTSGPDPRRHRVVDVAAVDTTTGATVSVVWPLTPAEYAAADPQYLAAYDRRFGVGGQRSVLDVDAVSALSSMLFGNTLGSIDPVTTASFLIRLFDRVDMRGRWHRRMADLGALAAGARGLPATALPTLDSVAAILGVARVGHSPSAVESARCAAACFAALVPAVDDLPGPAVVPLRVVKDS